MRDLPWEIKYHSEALDRAFKEYKAQREEIRAYKTKESAGPGYSVIKDGDTKTFTEVWPKGFHRRAANVALILDCDMSVNVVKRADVRDNRVEWTVVDAEIVGPVQVAVTHVSLRWWHRLFRRRKGTPIARMLKA